MNGHGFDLEMLLSYFILKSESRFEIIYMIRAKVRRHESYIQKQKINVNNRKMIMTSSHWFYWSLRAMPAWIYSYFQNLITVVLKRVYRCIRTIEIGLNKEKIETKNRNTLTFEKDKFMHSLKFDVSHYACQLFDN